jgi:predicted transcriptional regulator
MALGCLNKMGQFEIYDYLLKHKGRKFTSNQIAKAMNQPLSTTRRQLTQLSSVVNRKLYAHNSSQTRYSYKYWI